LIFSGFVFISIIAHNPSPYASDLLIENLGNSCIGTRAAIGVASLPSNATVEITLIAKTV